MSRELTEKEDEIATIIAGYLDMMDKSVFPEKPIKNIFIVENPPLNDRGGSVLYISEEKDISGEGEHYLICGYGIDKKIEKAKEDPVKNILIKEFGKSDQDTPIPSSEEVIIGLAVHEVRHRVQEYFSKKKLFTPEIANEIKSDYLKKLIKFLELICLDKPDVKGSDRQFDALVIEMWCKEKWHWWIKEKISPSPKEIQEIKSKMSSIIKSWPN